MSSIIITTKFTPATDTRGSRISARSASGKHASVPYPHEVSGAANVHAVAAVALATRLGWSGTLAAAPRKRGGFTFTPVSTAHVAGVADTFTIGGGK